MKHALRILANSKSSRSPEVRADRRILICQLTFAPVLAIGACAMLAIAIVGLVTDRSGPSRLILPSMFLVGAATAGFGIRKIARRLEPQLIAEHICPNCGYPLVQRGSDGLLCTECGWTLNSSKAPSES